MRLLALDCAAGACSVALWTDGAIPASRCEAMARSHAEALLPMVDTVAGEAGVDLRSLDRVAVSVGPGSFTGLRVGLAAARGLALAAACPVIGVGTLEALAWATAPDERVGRTVLAALDARRGEVYIQPFNAALASLAPPAALPLEADLPWTEEAVLLVGTGASIVAAALGERGSEIALSQASEAPDAVHVAALAASHDERACPGFEVAPVYLRGAGAEQPVSPARSQT